MTPDLSKPTPAAAATGRVDVLFDEYKRDIYRRTDRLFAWLMGFQWIAGIIFAILVGTETIEPLQVLGEMFPYFREETTLAQLASTALFVALGAIVYRAAMRKVE